MWQGTKVLVTGGASFIGSHLVDRLLSLGAIVRVADDFSSGKLSNLQYSFIEVSSGVWISDGLEVYRGDLRDVCFTRQMVKGIEIVFHLAAFHGGRGYIDTRPADCCVNMLLDQLVLAEALRAGVARFCYASSACVYPTNLQQHRYGSVALKEEYANPFIEGGAFADREYGWAKLMGEMSLSAYHRQYGMKGVAARIFTAYGPRENESHAIIALIAKAFIKMDPYEIWGSGEQRRNFTYVDDIVSGLIRATEVIDDCSAINLGRSDTISINEAAERIFKLMNWWPSRVVRDRSKPEGVRCRVADLTRARALLGWEPKVSFEEGLARTVEWYVRNKDPEQVRRSLDRWLWTREGPEESL